MIEYKGYIGVVDFDPEIDLFHGTVINTQDMITFYGASVPKLWEKMQKSLEVYFEVCEEQRKAPNKPVSVYFFLIFLPKCCIIYKAAYRGICRFSNTHKLSNGGRPMDMLVERLDAKLREWDPNIAATVRERISEIMDLADQDALDIIRSRTVEQEVLDLLDEPVSQ